MKRAVIIAIAVAAIASAAVAGQMGKGGCQHGSMQKAACPAAMAGVERTVTNLDNGVKITMSSSDPKTVDMLQKRTVAANGDGCPNCPMRAEGVTRTVEKTESGVVITATSADAAQVKKLQEHAASMATGKGCCGGKGAGSCPRKSTAQQS